MLNETKDFLEMNLDELYDRFVSFVLSSTNAAKVIDELKVSKRYAQEETFQVMIDFSELLIGTISHSVTDSDYTRKIMKYIDIVDRSTVLGMWQLVSNAWNALGICYFRLVMFERALECYSHALRIERERGLFQLSPIVYSNMVNIFMEIDEFEKAQNCLDHAIVILEEHKDTISRYWDKYTGIYCMYLYLKIKKFQFKKEELKPYYDIIMAVDTDKINYTSKSLRLYSMFHYGFFHYESEELEDTLNQVKEMFGPEEYLLICHECVEFSQKIGKNYDSYIRELINLDESGVSHLPLANMQTYDILIDYYEKQRNQEELSKYRIKYIKAVKEHLKGLSDQQHFAINTIEQLVMSDEFKNTNNIRNVEFKLIAEETLKTKRELEKANAVLSKISSIDGLTQISNRRHFEEKVQNLLCYSHSNNLSLSVFMMDIDYFKRYNDTYGHLEGDEILKKVAKCFNEHFESVNGLSARFGGEEFVGAVAGLSIEETEKLAQGICDEIFQLGIVNKSVRGGIVTVSVGAVIATKVDVDMKFELIRIADESLYLAKASGKNRYEIKIL